jgi:hypothetical protein
MALPITVPFTFGNATTTQSLSSLDADFSTVYNAVNGIGNGTVSLSNVSITGGTISANLTASGIFSGTSNVSITSANGPVSINTNGNNAVYIDASQNVGIGVTPSPSTSKILQISGSGILGSAADGLAVASNTYYNGAWKYASTGAASIYSQTVGLHIWYSNASGGAGATYTPSESMRIQTTGNLAVGTTIDVGVVTVGTKAGYYGVTIRDVASNTAMMLFTNSAGATAGNIVLSGLTTTYGTASDYRLKENVQPMTTGLTKVSALKPVTYDWKFDGSQGEGFIAHELAEIVPYAVAGEKDAVNEDGSVKPQCVDYSKIVPHLVAAIQELSAKNDALEARLVALESK